MPAALSNHYFADGWPSVQIANPGTTIYGLAAERGVSLRPSLGPAHMLGRDLFYDASATLGNQARAVCTLLAHDRHPRNKLARTILTTIMLMQCLETLGPLAAFRPSIVV
jgi:hypothetical protein